MIKTSYQTPELRDANDNIVQQGAFGKNTALSNATNDGWIDYVMNNLEALHDVVGESSPTLDGNGHVVQPANLAIGDEDGLRLKTNYLKLSGGTMTGGLNVRQNLKIQDNQENVWGGFYVPPTTAAEQYLQLYGGESQSSNGGNLQLFSGGSFTLQSKNGTTAYNLVGGTDGTLKWRGNNVAVLASPAFTGNPTAPTQAISNSSTRLATTAFVKNYTVANVPLLGYTDEGVIRLFSTDDVDNVTINGTYIWTTSSASGAPVNRPCNHAKMIVQDANGSASCYQTVINGADGSVYSRIQTSVGGTWTWTAWKQTAYAEDVLPLTGGTLSGVTNIVVNGVSAWGVFNVGLTRGTAPSANTGAGQFSIGGASRKLFSRLRTDVLSNGSVQTQLAVYKNTESDSNIQVILLNPASGDYSFYPSADNSTTLGKSGNRWKQLYAGTTTIATSDERLKGNITDIPDEVLDAWGEVGWYQYQFKDAVAEKGETKARLHTGAIAQRIESVFTAHGLDANRYGLLCYDEWSATPSERDEDGNIVQEAQPAGNRYSLRYEEALCMEAAYQRRRADRLEARIEALERAAINHE